MIGLGKKSVQAKLVGNTLVVAFHNSNPNLIWKFDLERNHSFTLAMQGEDGDLELGITSVKGEFYPVARFASREDAEEALNAVQKILMRHKEGRFRTFVTWAAALIVVLFLGLTINRYFFSDSASGPTGSSITASAPPIKSGVLLPADQVLRPPQ